MLSLGHLKTFDVVMRTGSFAAAARELDYTPAAVSQQIASLERQLHVTLFERDAHGVQPTTISELIAGRCELILGLLDELTEQVRSLAAGGSGRLRFASFSTASSTIVPAVLARMSSQVPGVEIMLSEGRPEQLVARVIAHDIDLALAYEYELVPVSWPAELTRVHLFTEELLVLLPAGHPTASADTVQLRGLSDLAWIASHERSVGVALLERLAADAAFQPRIAYHTTNYTTVHRLVAAGLGASVIPALAREPTSGVAALRVEHEAAHRQVFVLVDDKNTNPLVALAIEMLRDCTRDFRAE